METLKNQVSELIQSSEYDKAVNLLSKKLGLSFKVEFIKNDYHFENDTTKRDIYQITLERGNRKYSFNFGQSVNKSIKFENKINKRRFTSSGQSAGNHSYRYLYPEKFPKTKFEERYGEFKIINGEAPTLYAVLVCLQKYDVGSFEDFCNEFGYEIDSIKVKKTYKAVVKEYNKLCTLLSDNEMQVLQEIH